MPPITLYHCPGSRSSGTLYLLEELGIPYRIKITDVRAGAGQTPEYLAINPMGKVPAIDDGGEIVSESSAIGLYLGDKYSLGQLAPEIGDPRRALYLRWLFFAPLMDAVMVERMVKREPIPGFTPGYGDYERIIRTWKAWMGQGPWLLGEQFSVADAVVGSGIPWAFRTGVLPNESPFTEYAARVEARPAFQLSRAKDAG